LAERRRELENFRKQEKKKKINPLRKRPRDLGPFPAEGL
jgi:hypothetical protein